MGAVASGDEALNKALTALEQYDWGSDREPLGPIENAVNETYGDSKAQLALEQRLLEVLAGNASFAAKGFVCRQLSIVGSAASAPALAEFLDDAQLSHMARYALERIPDEEAVVALREALPTVADPQKVGIINSLGVRRDALSTAALIALAESEDHQLAAAAIQALGKIGTVEAGQALGELQAEATEALRLPIADANLACAERLLADGKKLEAMKIYRLLSKQEDLKHVQLAARRGLLAALKGS
jgi:HEAT repeat protein